MKIVSYLLIAAVLVSCDAENTNADTQTEGPACIAMTPAGNCNAQLMCGCAPDWCKWMLDVTDCTLVEGCTAGVVGTLAIGEECDEAMIIPDPPWCVPGSICLRLAGEADGLCRELCSSDDDCSTDGQSCTTPDVSFDPTDPHTCVAASMEIPFGICM